MKNNTLIQNKEVSNENLLKEMKAIGDKCVTDVRAKVKGKQYSDVIIPQDDGSELQFVNLVQEGGGVWGIALVGYTYVLEGMGIRFMKLAGTSAGAINTMVMAAVGKREDAKSEKILEYLVKKDFSELIDGHPIAKSFIRWFIFQKNAVKKIKNSLIYILSSCFLFMFLGSLLMWGKPVGILALEIWLGIATIVFFGVYRTYVKKEKEENKTINKESDDTKAVNIKAINKQIFAVISIFFLALFVIYLVSLFSNKYPNFQTGFDCFLVALFFVFSVITCFKKDSYVIQIQLLGAFVSFVVLTIAIMHIYNFYPIEQLFSEGQYTPPSALTPYLHTSTLGISLFIMLIAYFGSFGYFLYKRFTNSQYGINPGNNFRDWIDELMEQNETKTFADLKNKFDQPIDKIKHRTKSYGEIEDLMKYKPGDGEEESVCLITGEIYTNTKIEFPKMASMFWESPEDVCLADLVRASMSIPIFFEAFRRKPNQIPKSGRALREKYMAVGELTTTHLTDIENNAGFAFMDGGIISNFPINKFFKPIPNSRLPTFGVLLNDPYETPSDSLLSIIGSVFNTSRKHYDRSFLAEHEFYKQCISNIDVKNINWLNFELDDKEKIELFRAGAEAAEKFLNDFSWGKYQEERNQWINDFFKFNLTK